MFTLSKKKSDTQDSTQNQSLPPLPEDLPPLDADDSMSQSEMPNPPQEQQDVNQLPEQPISNAESLPDIPEDQSSQEENTHDMIPDELGAPQQNQDSFSPQSLPEESQENTSFDGGVNEQQNQQVAPQQPLESGQNEQGLPQVPSVNTQSNLPEVPDIQEQVNEPQPRSNEKVPTPPPVFADESIYDTPEEIRHIVRRKEQPSIKPEEEQYTRARPTPQHQPDKYDYQMEAAGGNHTQSLQEHKGPLFVDIESFQTMIDDIDTIKKHIKMSEQTLKHLDEIKTSKDKELESWRSQLEDINRKINYVDKVLFNEA
ncbi:MAG: hypothetical protein ACMXYE_00665 [Candidatus Woesearchaeota archaeon]